ncbi:unnamed protein product [Linum tenue]|uniref:Aminotransferase-like plant mobile domain-containing protein n=3 Tax=Linum tenue TaxID=586396 RepID=A0AAV0NZL8_9ROSI|nr:unnamed protein product [Linum tenue]
MPFGEVTITLEDVATLTGLAIDGDAVIVDIPDEDWSAMCLRLLGQAPTDLGGGVIKISRRRQRREQGDVPRGVRYSDRQPVRPTSTFTFHQPSQPPLRPGASTGFQAGTSSSSPQFQPQEDSFHTPQHATMGGGHMGSGSTVLPHLDVDEWERVDLQMQDQDFQTSHWAYEQQRREGPPDEQVQSQVDDMFGTQDQDDGAERAEQLPPRDRRPARCGTGGHLVAEHGGRRGGRRGGRGGR